MYIISPTPWIFSKHFPVFFAVIWAYIKLGNKIRIVSFFFISISFSSFLFFLFVFFPFPPLLPQTSSLFLNFCKKGGHGQTIYLKSKMGKLQKKVFLLDGPVSGGWGVVTVKGRPLRKKTKSPNHLKQWEKRK